MRILYGDRYYDIVKSYPWEIRSLRETSLESIASNSGIVVDDNGWVTITSYKSARILVATKSLMQRCSGIKFDVKDGSTREFFELIDDDHLDFPMVDMKGIKDACAMFAMSTVRSFKGFLNCEDLVLAANMFNSCKCLNGGIDILPQCKKLADGTKMFYVAKANNHGTSIVLDNLLTAKAMFSQSSGVVPSILSEDTFKCPKLEIASNMFFGVPSLQKIESIELQSCLNNESMFDSCGNLEEVGQIVLNRSARIN